jgi:hypothetical protein
VCFQETHSNNNIEKYWEDEWGNKCVFSHHDSKSAGVCVMFKKGLKNSQVNFALWVRTDAMYIFFHQDNVCTKDLEVS